MRLVWPERKKSVVWKKKEFFFVKFVTGLTKNADRIIISQQFKDIIQWFFNLLADLKLNRFLFSIKNSPTGEAKFAENFPHKFFRGFLYLGN